MTAKRTAQRITPTPQDAREAADAKLGSLSGYQAIFENTGTAMVIMEKDTTLSLVNSEFERLSGFTKGEIEGKKRMVEFVAKDDLERMRGYLRVRRTDPMEAPRNNEFRFINREGIVKDILLTVGSITGTKMTVASLLDITERKRTEEALRESEKRYRLLADNAADTIWTVDLNMRLTYASPSITRLLGYSVKEAMAKAMEEVFTPASFEDAMKALAEELAVEKMEQKDLARYRVLALELKRKDGSIVPVEAKYTFLRDLDGQPVEILAVVRDITERRRAEEEVRHSVDKLQRTMRDAIQGMAMIGEMRNPYTAGHQERVANLALTIAQEMGLPERQVTGTLMAALVHDIGEVGIPAEILLRPSVVSETEMNVIKTHPQVGYDILQTIEFAWPVADIVLQHHERMDGSGYPEGLSGQDILLEARILAVADVVEAMVSSRPHRAAVDIERALEEISSGKGILYDPDVVDACLRLFGEKGFTFG